MFEFKWLPFVLRNAPTELQRLTDRLFGPELEEQTFCYLDDIIVASPTFEEHLSTLERICERLKNAGLTINLTKSEFCRSRLKYLGFIVDQEELGTDPSRKRLFLVSPVPKMPNKSNRS